MLTVQPVNTKTLVKVLVIRVEIGVWDGSADWLEELTITLCNLYEYRATLITRETYSTVTIH